MAQGDILDRLHDLGAAILGIGAGILMFGIFIWFRHQVREILSSEEIKESTRLPSDAFLCDTCGKRRRGGVMLCPHCGADNTPFIHKIRQHEELKQQQKGQKHLASEKRTLLRATSAPPQSGDTLLRAAGAGKSTDPAQLLHPLEQDEK